MNKFYTVQGKNSDYTNIVIASSVKEAKRIGMNTEFTENVEFLDLRVNAIKAGQGFYQDEPEINFTIGGKGFIYTELKPQLCDWKNFIHELERQNRIWAITHKQNYQSRKRRLSHAINRYNKRHI